MLESRGQWLNDGVVAFNSLPLVALSSTMHHSKTQGPRTSSAPMEDYCQAADRNLSSELLVSKPSQILRLITHSALRAYSAPSPLSNSNANVVIYSGQRERSRTRPNTPSFLTRPPPINSTRMFNHTVSSQSPPSSID